MTTATASPLASALSALLSAVDLDRVSDLDLSEAREALHSAEAPPPSPAISRLDRAQWALLLAILSTFGESPDAGYRETWAARILHGRAWAYADGHRRSIIAQWALDRVRTHGGKIDPTAL